MRVKICGLTRTEDALLALELGATEIGFIFAESPRRVSKDSIKDLICQLPRDVRSIAVFKDQPLSKVLSVTSEQPFKGVQLHGLESPDYVKELNKLRPDLFLIKTIGFDKKPLLDYGSYELCHAFLFDSPGSHFRPHERSPIETKLEYKSNVPFYLAGGLNPSNILRLIDQHRPDGVDISSGVESSVGVKDEQLLRQLFESIKDINENRY